MPSAGKVKLEIYDILGQKIAAFKKEYRQGGHYEIIWNAAGYANGLYFYSIDFKEFTDVKKMILLK